MKKLGLELGGNAPFIIFDDCNLDDAVKGAIASKFRNSGQTCICANRILVQEGIYDQFIERFVKAVQNLKVAHGLKEDCDIGPLINKSAVENTERLVEDAVKNLNKEMAVYTEECFAPIAPV